MSAVYYFPIAVGVVYYTILYGAVVVVYYTTLYMAILYKEISLLYKEIMEGRRVSRVGDPHSEQGAAGIELAIKR